MVFKTCLVERQPIRADVSVFLLNDAKPGQMIPPSQNVENQIKHFLGVVQSDSEGLAGAAKWCLAYLAVVSKMNGDDGVMYGLNSDGSNFSLLSYDATDRPTKRPSVRTFACLLVYVPAQVQRRKQGDVEECSTIPHLVYTIICN